MTSHGFHPFGGRVSRHFGDSLSPDDAYLSYYDVRLTKDDVDCIKDDWLTDNVIAFYEEYLERERLPAYPNPQINLLRPSMCFLLVQTPDPLTLKDALPSFEQSTHIFLPINDCRSPNEAEGGSHWSLLVVSIIDGAAFHYDSLRPPMNVSFASMAAQKLATLLGTNLRFTDLQDAPQQENGSDCGVFVCLEIEELLFKRLLQGRAQDNVSMHLKRGEIDASKGRKHILKLIEQFRREGKRTSQSRSRSPFRGSEDSKDPPRVGD